MYRISGTFCPAATPVGWYRRYGIDFEPLVTLPVTEPASFGSPTGSGGVTGATVPGAPYPFDTSSSTSTQSCPYPLEGGLKVCAPAFENSPTASADPSRGSYHQAFTDDP